MLHVPDNWRRRGMILPVLAVTAVVAVACGSGDDTPPPRASAPSPVSSPVPPAISTATVDLTPVATAPAPSPTPAASATPVTAASPTPDADGPFRRPVPVQITLTGAEAIAAQRWQSVWGWNTNFNNKTVNLTEIDTLLRRDGIKPVDDPLFATASEAPDYMRDREPVIAIIVDGDARAYPVGLLDHHELVNDRIGGKPVTVGW